MIHPAVGLDGLSTIPYIVRPLDVVSPLMKNNAPEHMVITGLLHDVVEDEDYTLSDIRHEFGDEVATLVDGASEPEELINADRDIIRDYDRLGDGVWDIFNPSKDSVAWYSNVIG